jgi:hypothetical protein
MDNDDNARQSEDDALEEERREADGLFNPQTDEETLAEDGDTPAAPADDVPPSAPLDDPAGDTDVDEDEAYQEGKNQAADNNDREIGVDDQPRPLEPED